MKLIKLQPSLFVSKVLKGGLFFIFFGSCMMTAMAQAPSKKETEKQILPLPSSSARDLFSRYKDRLMQVRVLLNSANEQSSLGSGFVVRNDVSGGAWVITNYHVISSLAIQPEKYNIELRSTNERKVKASLVAVDVIHDLAVLHVEPDDQAKSWPSFELRESVLSQGEKVFSLGNPLELGFLISEGIYNGLVESRIYDQLLFSGALNSGMSGGPAIDDLGRVVGVNVATQRNGEQLSFLVPISYAQTMLKNALSAKPRKEWRTEIARQLLVHQSVMSAKLLQGATPSKIGFSSQVLAGRTVATLDGTLTKCWAGGRDGERLKYQRDTLDCSLKSDLFVRRGYYTGSMNIRHVLLKNDTLSKPQFMAINKHSYYSKYNKYSGGETTSKECRDDYVQVVKHTYRVAVCINAYKKFEGIYDFNIVATQMDDDSERLISTMNLNGFSFDNGQSLSKMFLERLQ
jgi:serine protease Do